MSKSERPSDHPQVSRRTVFAGAGALGALGAIAAATGLSRNVTTPATPLQTADAKAAEAGGYQLTDHVKQYYATARL